MIDFDYKDQVAQITMNRPEKRNALNIALLRQFKAALEKAQDARVVVIRGAGKVFCAGMDLTEVTESSKEQESGSLLADVFRSIYQMTGITIAAVQGAAVAGGTGIMCACDLIIAEESSFFGFPEVKKGLVPAQLIPFLTRQLRQRDLRELLLLGRSINANDAKAIGLINRVVSDGQLDTEIEKVIKEALEGAPKAIKETKALIDHIYSSTFEEDMSQAFEQHFKMRHTEEALEGVKAYFEKRKPNWEKLT